MCIWDDPKERPILIQDLNENSLDNLLSNLADLNKLRSIEHVIIEEYRVFNDKFNHQGDKVHTAQVIGLIKGFCRTLKIPFTEQPARVRTVAALWSGTKVPRGHMPDYMSAYLHGYFWLHKNGFIPPRVLDENDNG